MNSTKASAEPLYLEDIHVGDRWVSEWREITADDVANFASLTGDHDPLHTEDAKQSPFGEPVAHGLLGLSVLAGLSSARPKAATLALIGISDWQFEAPIFFGDNVQVVTEIHEIQQHDRRAGRVTWVRQLINQTGRKVSEGIEIDFPITRQDLSELTATTLHTVSRLLSSWEKQGLVMSKRKRITVRDAHALVVLSQA